MKLFRIGLVSALLMASCSMSVWAADATLTMETSNAQQNSQSVTLNGVPADCHSLQVTFDMSKEQAYTFQAAKDLNAEGIRCAISTNGTQVTFYVTSKTQVLTNTGTLSLGQFAAQTEFTVDAIKGSKMLNETSSVISESVQENDSNDGNTSGTTGGSTDGSTGGTTGSTGSSGSSSGSTTSSKYSITAANVQGGTISVNPTSAAKGTTVSITLSPNQGYQLQQVTALDGAGKNLTLSKVSDHIYQFTMPNTAVQISALFEPIQENTPEQEHKPLSFTDVSADSWYYEAVQYIYDAGLMSGTSDTTFSPNETTTRAMIVAVLHRMEGEPEATTPTYPFADVLPGAYYQEAVYWAQENGIVSGYDASTFAPNDAITREQMAAILYRYATYKGYSVSGRANITDYLDADQISDYA